MQEQETRQYGLWTSPITPQHLAKGLNLTDLAWNDDGTLVWREVHSGKGWIVLKKPDGNASRELNNSIPTRGFVGYGGGEFTAAKGDVYFFGSGNGRLYRQPIEAGEPEPLTPAFGGGAAPVVSPDGKYLVYVHTYEGKDSLAIVDTQGHYWPRKLVEGNDFYMQPCWHPDGKHIAWITWNQPNMPWDGTQLMMGDLTFTDELPGVKDSRMIAGGENISIFQPAFSPDGKKLAYVSDESGWWQLYLYDLSTEQQTQLTFTPAEHGLPGWVQGMRTFAFTPDSNGLYFIRNQNGQAGLWKVDLASGKEAPVSLGEEYGWVEQVAVSPADGRVAVLASGYAVPRRLLVWQDDVGVHIERRSMPEDLPRSYYSAPQSVVWKGLDGEDVYGIFYSPQNPAFQGKGAPPLVVLIHGGPTAQRGMSFDGQVQFFASRGYAVLQVNYRGSTGYGRKYRDALKRKWGIYDVEDAVSGTRYLFERGLVDETKMVIMGGSAGGYTVLKALEDYPGVFKAGVCLYGVSNQFTLVADTHKFEARYSDFLIGSLPEDAETYRKRSPVFYADKIKDALIVFQGEDDRVVPKSQSDEIVDAVRRNGVPCEYHVYPGEGHGFRKNETIEHFYTTLEKFLRQYVIYA